MTKRKTEVILLFDGLDGPHRRYELGDVVGDGKVAHISFCHPDDGEVFHSKTDSLDKYMIQAEKDFYAFIQ